MPEVEVTAGDTPENQPKKPTQTIDGSLQETMMGILEKLSKNMETLKDNNETINKNIETLKEDFKGELNRNIELLQEDLSLIHI